MFWIWQFNSFYFNGLPLPLGVPDSYYIKYWEYFLPNEKVALTDVPNISDGPEINFQNYNIAKQDGMGNSEYTLQSKNINVSWWIRWIHQADMEEQILEIQRKFYKKWQKLYYNRKDWKELYTIAYLTSLNFDRNKNTINYVPFTAVFTTLEPFFYATKISEYKIIDQSEDISGSLLYISWTYKCDPVIYISMKTATWVDEVSVTIDGQTITINEPLDTGDYIIIDGKQKDVFINSIWGKDYIWSFPKLDIGEKAFDISINGTWTADIYIQREDTYV